MWWARRDDVTESGPVAVVQVDAIHLVTGDHDVVHAHVLEVENIDEHTAVPGGYQLPRVCDDRAQLFLGDVGVSAVLRVDTEQAQQAAGAAGAPGQMPAPDFTAPAYHQGKFTQVKLSDQLGKWVVLCFYPGDFTFV